MNGRIGLLGGLLVVQVLLIAGLLLSGSDAQRTQGSLLAFSTGSAQSLTIEQGPAAVDAEDAQAALESVTLKRQDAGWEIAGLPADADKIEGLLARLADLRSAWPVATTARAQSRFEVADDRYRKRVEVALGDGPSQTLLLGSSPGFKRVHARVPGSDAVYSIALAEFDVPTATVDWLDKTLLALPVDVSGMRREGHWQASLSVSTAPVDVVDAPAEPPSRWLIGALVSGALPGAPAVDMTAADPQAMQTLVGRFRNLQVIGLAPAESAATLVDTFMLETVAGDAYRYELFEDSVADRFFLARGDIDGRFEIAGYLAEQFRADLASLVPAAAADAPAESGTDDPTPAS